MKLRTPPRRRPLPVRLVVELLESREAPGDVLGLLLERMTAADDAGPVNDPTAPLWREEPDTIGRSDDIAILYPPEPEPGPDTATSDPTRTPATAFYSIDAGIVTTTSALAAAEGLTGEALLSVFNDPLPDPFGTEASADKAAPPHVAPPEMPSESNGGGGGGSGAAAADAGGGGGGGGESSGIPGPNVGAGMPSAAPTHGTAPAAAPPAGSLATAQGNQAAVTAPTGPVAQAALTPDVPMTAPAAAVTAAAPASPAATQAALQSEAQLPLQFEGNAGQFDPQVAYAARGPGYNFFVTHTGQAVLDLQQSVTRGPDGQSHVSGDVIAMTLAGASATPHVVGLEPLGGTVNYIAAGSAGPTVTSAGMYGQVQVQGVYPGVDLSFHAAAGSTRQLEFDLTVHPGADPSGIHLSFAGAQGLSTDAQGNLLLQTPGGPFVEHAPVLYQQDSAGNHQAVKGSFAVEADGSVGFQVGAYDPSRPLVIDPVSSYSTLLGGNSLDQNRAVAVDSSGNAYITGSTTSTNFPTTTGAYSTTFHSGSASEVFVTKLNADGTGLSYSTYLGGYAASSGYGIAVDSSGDAFIAGDTGQGTPAFPTTTGAYKTTWATGATTMAFLTELNSSGSGLVYSTLYGGGNITSARALALDTSGNVWVCGLTSSTNLPTASPAQASYGGGT
jgi:hypothetical protein